MMSSRRALGVMMMQVSVTGYAHERRNLLKEKGVRYEEKSPFRAESTRLARFPWY